MTIKTKIALAGHYTIRKYSGGGILVQELEFENLITNGGLNMLGNDTTWAVIGTSTLFNACYVGTGSTAPANGDTALAAYLATSSARISANSINLTPDGGNYYMGQRFVYRFNQGVATGNLSELGTGTSNTGLFSRALVRDPNTGNPITITVLPDEFLDVTFELRAYVSPADTAGIVTISGVTYDTLTRIADINSTPLWAGNFRENCRGYVYAGPEYFIGGQANQCSVYAGTLGAITARPGGASTIIPSNSATVLTTPAAYVSGSFERKATITLGLSDGNVAGGMRSMTYRNGFGYWQTQFTPAIPKTASFVLTLDTVQGWGRVP
ncbi:hypothetical protein [Stenotrophomonas sp. NA06056]|uniref:hypothetical protein n=1 Tax=Stenotrophomonas sp. NA06056 TaxID=2742129 RepID=UPI00158B4614|nr:hypothetical protein [Stenotrophomonas sp. NA06056]QKW57013.1 hypothetical protein HUT07_10455 [Stenotrophomonas sp. NA06056]